MSTDHLEARAVEMSRDLAEANLARRIALDVLQAVRSLPENSRADAADSILHKRLLMEMLNYKDRLTRHVEEILTKAMRAVEAKGE